MILFSHQQDTGRRVHRSERCARSFANGRNLTEHRFDCSLTVALQLVARIAAPCPACSAAAVTRGAR